MSRFHVGLGFFLYSYIPVVSDVDEETIFGKSRRGVLAILPDDSIERTHFRPPFGNPGSIALMSIARQPHLQYNGL
jgi:hypothetical protein